jgi:hypothetical protein
VSKLPIEAIDAVREDRLVYGVRIANVQPVNIPVRNVCLLTLALLVGTFFSSTVHAQHGLLREVYEPIFGVGMEALLNDENFPSNPASVRVIDEFESPESLGTFYGQRIRGWVRAPQNGAYTFWIASDDQSQLFLSRDDRPGGATLIAQVFGVTDPHEYEAESSQRSSPVTLVEGQLYYIEALMVNSGGPDHLSVRWQLPDGTMEDPILGERLYVEVIPPVISEQPRSATVEEGKSATFSVQLANRGAVGVQWLRNGLPIPGATNITLSIPVAAGSENGTRFEAKLTNEFATTPVISAPAFLVVSPDVTPPILTAALALGENGLLALSFSEPIDPASATNPANYAASGGVQVRSATIGAQGRTVILETTPLIFGQTYVITVNNLRDRARQPNMIDEDSSAEFTYHFNPLHPELVYGKTERPGPSTRRSPLTISEIMYHPAPRKDALNLEFIELYRVR